MKEPHQLGGQPVQYLTMSERILRIRLKSHVGFVFLIAVNAPTNIPGNEEETEAFYQSL